MSRGYPMVLATAVTGSIVGNASILMLFPQLRSNISLRGSWSSVSVESELPSWKGAHEGMQRLQPTKLHASTPAMEG